jgi:hypothetical protein
VKLASRHHPVAAQCLHRSLVLHQWLARKGVQTELRIGVKKAGPELKAHAWVEFKGNPVNDAPADLVAFVPLARGDGRFPEWASRNDDGHAKRNTRTALGEVEWQ